MHDRKLYISKKKIVSPRPKTVASKTIEPSFFKNKKRLSHVTVTPESSRKLTQKRGDK